MNNNLPWQKLHHCQGFFFHCSHRSLRHGSAASIWSLINAALHAKRWQAASHPQPDYVLFAVIAAGFTLFRFRSCSKYIGKQLIQLPAGILNSLFLSVRHAELLQGCRHADIQVFTYTKMRPNT